MALDRDMIASARSLLYSAVISDVLDGLDDFDHALNAAIRPVDDGVVLFGRARTGRFETVGRAKPGEDPYALEIQLVDDLEADEVVVFACPPGGKAVPWGELLTTAAMARGAAGCVTDGLTRDARRIREAGFPVFAAGYGPYDSKSRAKVMAIDVPIVCGGVPVKPGDWLFGDVDGVVVIPDRLVLTVIERALEKVAGETRARDDLRAGHSVRAVFDRYGIL